MSQRVKTLKHLYFSIFSTWAKEQRPIGRRRTRKRMASVEEFNEVKKELREVSEALKSLTLHVKNNEVTPETVKAIENKITLVSKDANSYERIRRDVSVDPAILPDKFNTIDIPKFKSTDNPLYHLSAFETIMTINKIDK